MTLPETKIQRINIEPGRRILAVSDIHGCLSYLKKALEKADFCEDDLLIIVGDIIVRGEDSLGTLRYVMELCEKGNVIPLIGNNDIYWVNLIHEFTEKDARGFYDYIMKLRSWSGTSFFDEFAHECGYVIHSPEDMLTAKERIISHFEKEFRFLTGLPAILETQNYTFVHGGLRDKNVDANTSRSVYDLTKYDAFMSETPHRFDKYVIVGHWPVSLYSTEVQQFNPVFDHEKKIISIDGGCGIKRECQMNVLIIPDICCSIGEVSWISYDEIPTIRAFEKQEAGTDSVHINWMNREISVIERGEEFSYIEHIHSGRKLYVPNSYLRGDNECSDCTDNMLSVEAGDTLSLIEETSRGCIVKKNGIVGWYCGAYEK